MAAGATRNLFIQIGGSASDLTIAAKAGKSALLDIGAGAEDVQAKVRGAFQQLGGTVADQADAMEKAYAKTFANIRATAQAALSVPTSGGQGLLINLSAAQREAEQAQTSATYLRTLADAQARLVETGQEASAGAKSLAVSLELQAIAAEKGALASKETVVGLQRLAAESGIAVTTLDEVAGAHTRMGSSGLIAEHVVRSFSDSISAGQSPVRAFALEVPRVAEALQFLALETNATEGALGKFASFMGGGWGLALTLGVSLLTPLIAHLFEGADASDKMKDKVLTLVDALSAEQFGTEAATKALQDYNREKERARENDSNASQRTIEEARQRIQEATQRRDQFSHEADTLATRPAAGDESAQLARAETIQNLRAKADAQAKQIADAQQAVRNAEIDQAKEGAKAAADPIEAIRQKYKHLADAASEAASKSDALAAGLNKVLANYAKAEAAEIKSAEAARRAEEVSGRNNRQVGRQIDLSQAESIVRGIGGTVTSSYRSTAEQQVLYDRYRAGTGPLAAKPGTSEHERGQALDVAKSAGVTLATLKKAFDDAGVKLTEALDEGNHFHVAWGPKGPSADALARRQQAEADKAANQDGAYQGEVRAALDAIAGAKDKLPQTPEQQYQTTSNKLEDDFIQRSAGLEDQVDAHKLSAEQAAYLLSLAYAREQLDLESAAHKELADKLAIAGRAEEASTAAQIGLLQARLNVTDDPSTRRSLASQILDKKQQAERDSLSRKIQNAQSDPNGAADAVVQLQTLPQQQAAEREALNRQYASPLEAKRLQLQQSVGDVHDDVEKIESDSIDQLGSSLETAATKALKLHGLLGSIAGDLLKLVIEREAELPIANALTGKGGGGGIFSAIAGLFGGGRAVGGGVSSSQFYLVGENGPELFAPGKAGTIVPNHVLAAGVPSMPRLGRGDVAALRAGPAETHYHITNSFVDQALWDKMHGIAAGHVQQAAPQIAAGGAQLSEITRRRAQSRSFL